MMTYEQYVETYLDETQRVYMNLEEPRSGELEMFEDTNACVVIDNEPVYYRFTEEGLIYTDKLGNELNVSLEGSNHEVKLINKKGTTMTTDYEKTMATYGLSEELIEKFKARGCAYKEHSYYEGKMYVGSYLMLDNKGNPFTVLETTFKGDLQKSRLNVATLGFYPLAELVELGTVECIKQYERKIMVQNVNEDDLFEQQAHEDSHTISIYKVTLGEVEAVYFYNETTGESNGSKLFSVYTAEQILRNKPKNLDDLFEDNLQTEIAGMSMNMDEAYAGGEDMSKYAKEEA